MDYSGLEPDGDQLGRKFYSLQKKGRRRMPAHRTCLQEGPTEMEWRHFTDGGTLD